MPPVRIRSTSGIGRADDPRLQAPARIEGQLEHLYRNEAPDLEKLLDALQGLADSPALDPSRRRDVYELMRLTEAGEPGGLPYMPQPGIGTYLGDIAGTVFPVIDFPLSVVKSTVNQAFGPGNPLLFGEREDTGRPNEEFGFSGWWAGTSFGSDPVTSDQILRTFLTDTGVDTLDGANWSLGWFSWLPVIDEDTRMSVGSIARLATDVGLDPITYMSGGLLVPLQGARRVARGAAEEAVEGATRGAARRAAFEIVEEGGEEWTHESLLKAFSETGELPLATNFRISDARRGKEEVAKDLLDRSRVLMASRGGLEGFDEWVAETFRKNGLPGLIVASKKAPGYVVDGVEVSRRELLGEIGVRGGLGLGHLRLPGTEGWQTLTNVLRGWAQRGKLPGFEGLGRLLRQSALDDYVLKHFADDAIAEIQFRGLARYAANSARGAIAQAGDFAQIAADLSKTLAKPNGVLDDLTEDVLRPIFEQMTTSDSAIEKLADKTLKKGVREQLEVAVESGQVFKKVIQDIVDWGEARGLTTMADWARPQYVTDDLGRTGPARVSVVDDVLVEGGDMLAEFVQDETIDPLSRVFGPMILSGAQRLDAITDAFVVEQGQRFSLRQLIGRPGTGSDFGFLSRNVESMRQYFEAIGILEALEQGGQLRGLVSQQADEMFDTWTRRLQDLGDTKVRASIKAAWGIDQNLAEEGLEALAALNVSPSSAINDVIVSGETAGQFHYFMKERLEEAFVLLNEEGGDKALRQAGRNLYNVAVAHQQALRKLVDDTIRAGDSKGILQGIERQYGHAASKAAREMSKDKLERETRRIMFNTWFRPDLADNVVNRVDKGMAELFSTEVRATLAVAHQRIPQVFDQFYRELDDYLGDWADKAMKVYQVDADSMAASTVAAMQRLDAFYDYTDILTRFFGDFMEEAAGKADTYLMRGIRPTDAQIDNLKRGMKVRYNPTAGVFDFDFVPGFVGETPQKWGQLMADQWEFARGLKRATVGEAGSAFDKAFGMLARANRTWRAGALFSGNYLRRNWQGQYIINYLQGVRTGGIGGYREWAPVYEVSRRAIRDEIERGVRQGSSEIWEEIKDRGMRRQAKMIAKTGVLTPSTGVGRVLDRALETQERGFRSERVGRAVDAAGRATGFFETGYTALAEAVTSGGRIPRVAAREFRNVPEGLQASTRRQLETYSRGALMWSKMRRGGASLDEALAAVSRNHFDYWDLTQAGQKIDEITPFYVFRSRMTSLAVSTGFQTPGVPVNITKAYQSSSERDPWGAGRREVYTFGLGSTHGLGPNPWSMELDSADPFAEGFNQATLPAPGFAVGDPLRAWFWEPVSPLVEYSLLNPLGITVGRDDAWEDKFVPVASTGGIMPRFMAAVDGMPGVKAILEGFEVYKHEDGVAQINGRGIEFLTEMLPVAAHVENALMQSRLLQGYERPRDRAEAQVYDDELDREVWNSILTMLGFPVRLLSREQRQAAVDGEIWDVLDRVGVLKAYDELGIPTHTGLIESVLETRPAVSSAPVRLGTPTRGPVRIRS